MEQKITIVEVDDLGPVLARADHYKNAVEVNAKAFYKLPSMVQEFILCHEFCHLKHQEWDENRTNQLASKLFLQRATSEADLQERKKFLSYLSGQEGERGNYSNWVQFVIAAIPALVALGVKIYSGVKQKNAGWYSWDKDIKQKTLETMLTSSFEQARRTNKHSASEYLWAQLQGYTNKDDTLEQFLDRSQNAWVKTEIAKYETQYGFKLDEVTPIDLTAYPIVIVAIGVVVGVVIYKLIKSRKK